MSGEAGESPPDEKRERNADEEKAAQRLYQPGGLAHNGCKQQAERPE